MAAYQESGWSMVTTLNCGKQAIPLYFAGFAAGKSATAVGRLRNAAGTGPAPSFD